MRGSRGTRSPSMSRFVVLGTQRTGTTLLVTSLANHPDILCFGESFKTFQPRSKVDTRDSGYLTFREQRISRRIGHYLWRRRVTEEFLDELYAAEPRAAVGFKLMFNQIGNNASIVEYLIRNDVKAINVYRDNVLKTLVSRLSAQSSGVFHATRATTRPKVVVPTESLLRRLRKLESEKDCWVRHLGNRLPMMRISYEEFVANPDHHGAQVLGFLGVSKMQLRSALAKLNPDNLEAVVENLAEVKRVISGSPFEAYLN